MTRPFQVELLARIPPSPDICHHTATAESRWLCCTVSYALNYNQMHKIIHNISTMYTRLAHSGLVLRYVGVQLDECCAPILLGTMTRYYSYKVLLDLLCGSSIIRFEGLYLSGVIEQKACLRATLGEQQEQAPPGTPFIHFASVSGSLRNQYLSLDSKAALQARIPMSLLFHILKSSPLLYIPRNGKFRDLWTLGIGVTSSFGIAAYKRSTTV